MVRSKKTVNLGVIGLGMGRGHLEGYSRAANAKIVGITDINEERLKLYKKQYNLDKAFTDYRDLLALKNLDAVSVAVPNYLHKPIAIDALNAGKHVLVEKPMALNAKEGQRLIRRTIEDHAAQREEADAVALPDVGRGMRHEDDRVSAVCQPPESEHHLLFEPGIQSRGWFVEEEEARSGKQLDRDAHPLALAAAQAADRL